MAPGQVPVPSGPHVRLRSSALQLRLPTTTAPPGADESSEDGRQVFLPSYLPSRPAIVISKLAMKLGHHKYATTTSLRFCFACMFSRVSRSFRCHFLCGEKDGKVTQERKKKQILSLRNSPIPRFRRRSQRLRWKCAVRQLLHLSSTTVARGCFSFFFFYYVRAVRSAPFPNSKRSSRGRM